MKWGRFGRGGGEFHDNYKCRPQKKKLKATFTKGAAGCLGAAKRNYTREKNEEGRKYQQDQKT